MTRPVSFLSSECCLFLLLLIVVTTSSVSAGLPVYTLQNLQKTSTGYTGLLELQSGSGPYGNDIQQLKLQVFFDTETRLHIKITDANNQRWEVPNIVQVAEPTTAPSNMAYSIQFTRSPFGFKVIRNSDSSIIWDTNGFIFVFSDQYITISTSTPDDPNLYGLGERIHNFRLDPNNQVYTMWNQDNGNTLGLNLYGTHPFYLDYRYPNSHGVFLLNSNAMGVTIGNSSIKYEVIGGVLDFYFFLGPSPKDVIAQYHQVIGTPYMPPYWALGWHQCRFGYHNLSETMEVVAQYANHSIPLDTMWNDADYMHAYEDFSFDPVRFPVAEVRQFVEQLHANNQHYIVITDAGIHIRPGYEPYDTALAHELFINASTGGPISNKVWPGYTNFPDFFNPETTTYWIDHITALLKAVPIDGLWIDMNEIATFCDGQCNSTTDAGAGGFVKEGKPPAGDNPAFNPINPPFNPGKLPLWTRTISTDAVHYGGLLEYNVHDLYGTLETNVTRIALERIRGTRSVVISRSTYAGQGHIGGHWLGDNESTFQSMFLSIPGILAMNMFGIPLVGADVCGFNGAATEELCTRWMELGSFYPFARSHNSLGMPPQEPYVFGPRLAEISRNVLLNRYSLLPYYYTLFFKAHQNGGTVVRPLFFEFPEELVSPGVIQYIDRQFLVGEALMVSPVLDEGNTTVSAYFPQALWYDYYSGELMKPDENQWLTLEAPIDVINAHVRGGFIIPTNSNPQLTTYETRKQPFELIVALNETGEAFGDLFIDDGESLANIAELQYTFVEFSAITRGTTTKLIGYARINGYPQAKNALLGSVKVYGVFSGDVCWVTVDGDQTSEFRFDQDAQVLYISNLQAHMVPNFAIVWGC